jgi:hypothetical protein
LDTLAVVRLTAAKCKPLIVSVMDITLTDTANTRIFILNILCDL